MLEHPTASNAQVAARFKVQQHTVAKWRTRHGLPDEGTPKMSPGPPVSDDASVTELVEQGVMLRARFLADKDHVGTTRAKNAAVEFGILVDKLRVLTEASDADGVDGAGSLTSDDVVERLRDALRGR